MQHNYLLNEKTSNILCFFCIFSSLGWVTDSGSFLAKSIVLLFLICVAIFRIIKFGIIIPSSFIIWPVLFYVCAACIGIFWHGRSDDVNLFIKLAVAVLVVVSINKKKFFESISQVLDKLFILIVVGYFFQIIGVATPVPSFLLDPAREAYAITPALTVFRVGDPGRAYGFFWEPGVLALFCNISIVSRIFWKNELGLFSLHKEILLLIISMSLGGVIVAILLISIGLSRYRRYVDAFIFTAFVIFIGFLAKNFNSFQESLARMVNLFSVPIFGRDMFFDSSFNARSADMILPFIVAGDNFIFGNDSIDYLVGYSEIFRGQSENIITNSFGIVAYFYGYPCLLAFTCFTILFSFKFLKSCVFSAPLIFFLVMFFEPVPFVVITMVFFMMSFQSNGD